MKRTITLEKQPFINQLTNDLLTKSERKSTHSVKSTTINSLLNFSKSLNIIPSTIVNGMNLEMIIN